MQDNFGTLYVSSYGKVSLMHMTFDGDFDEFLLFNFLHKLSLSQS